MLRAIPVILLVLCLPAVALAGVEIGDQPEFELTTVDGERTSLSDHRGQVVVVDFWATWCRPCHASFDFWSSVSTEHEDLVVLAIAVDDETRVRGFLDDYPVPFDILLDPGQTVTRHFSPPSMPSAYILDRDGVVRYIHRGFRSAHRDNLHKQLESLIHESQEH